MNTMSTMKYTAILFAAIIFYLPVKSQHVQITKEELIALTPEWKGDRFADGRRAQQILQLNAVSHPMAIKAGDNVAANQTRFVRGRSRRLDIIERHTGPALGDLEPIHAEESSSKADRASRHIPYHRFLNQTHDAAKHEKESNCDQNPGHAADPALARAGKAAGGLFGNRGREVRIEI